MVPETDLSSFCQMLSSSQPMARTPCQLLPPVREMASQHAGLHIAHRDIALAPSTGQSLEPERLSPKKNRHPSGTVKEDWSALMVPPCWSR